MNTKTWILAASLIVSATAHAKTRLAIAAFTNKTGSSRCNVNWFSGTQLGSGMQDQLITAIQEDGRYDIYERENLNKIYSDEHNLVNSDKSSMPAKNGFKAAHYSVVGAITSFELCSGGLGGKVDVGGLLGFKKSGLDVGAKTQNAKVVLDMRVVDVETGRVVTSVKAEGSARSVGADVSGDIKGADFKSQAFHNTPLGEATREAIKDALQKIAAKVPADRQDREMPVTKSSSGTAGKTAAASTAAASSARKPAQAAKGGVSATTTTSDTFCNMDSNANLHVGKQFVSPESADRWAACRVLETSSTGKRVTVLSLVNGEQKVVSQEAVRKIASGASLKVGGKVFLKADEAKHGVTCKVIDTTSTQVVAICGRSEELTIAKENAFSLVAAPARAAASQK